MSFSTSAFQAVTLTYAGISSVPHEARVRKAVELADDLSLPFCQLELRYALSSSGHNSDDTKDGSAATLFGAINTALEGDRLTWTELISGLGASTTCQVMPVPPLYI